MIVTTEEQKIYHFFLGGEKPSEKPLHTENTWLSRRGAWARFEDRQGPELS
jgi:hypothetical protein